MLLVYLFVVNERIMMDLWIIFHHFSHKTEKNLIILSYVIPCVYFTADNITCSLKLYPLLSEGKQAKIRFCFTAQFVLPCLLADNRVVWPWRYTLMNTALSVFEWGAMARCLGFHEVDCVSGSCHDGGWVTGTGEADS